MTSQQNGDPHLKNTSLLFYKYHHQILIPPDVCEYKMINQEERESEKETRLIKRIYLKLLDWLVNRFYC